LRHRSGGRAARLPAGTSFEYVRGAQPRRATPEICRAANGQQTSQIGFAQPCGIESRKAREAAPIERLRSHRRQSSRASKWPVTPEVAGSSPVAPVKSPANLHVVLSGWTPPGRRLHTTFSTRRRNGQKRRDMRWRRDDFKPIQATSRLTAKAAWRLHRMTGGHGNRERDKGQDDQPMPFGEVLGRGHAPTSAPARIKLRRSRLPAPPGRASPSSSQAGSAPPPTSSRAQRCKSGG
jgi:hypothetical protein